jgi:heavy metal translocating P-type ATPase
VICCDYCGLPVPGQLRTDAEFRSPPLGDDNITGSGNNTGAGNFSGAKRESDESVYCCSGCRVAAAIEQSGGAEGANRHTLLRLGLGIFCTMNVMVFTMVLWSQDIYPEVATDPSQFSLILRGLFRYLALLFSLPVLFILGAPIGEGVWQALKRRTITTDLLITLGVVAAFLYSIVSVVRDQGHVYFEVACMVLVFVTLGRWLEAHGKLQTSAALDALARLLPDQVRRVRKESMDQEVDCTDREEVCVGDWLQVLPGERFALDGQILRGQAEVDEQIVTGESRPMTRGPGDQVSSGTLNRDGDLLIEVTAAAGEETVSRLLDLVRTARTVQGQQGQLADRLTAWFVPAVCLLSLLTFWWHASQGGIEGGGMQVAGIERGILAGLAVVLIACPCALGLATPMAIWSTMGRAARGQVLFRSGESLERLATVQVACFDKTGTITNGQPLVEQLITDKSTDRDVLLRRAKSLAASSTHTFSNAICEFADAESSPSATGPSGSVGFFPRTTVETRPGLGLVARIEDGTGTHCNGGSLGTSHSQSPDRASIDRNAIYLGSTRLMDQAGMQSSKSLQQSIERASASGASLTGIGWGNRLQGLFLFQESIRPEARGALARCRQLGLHTTLLTGDHRGRAARIEQELETPVEAEMLPVDKVKAIERLRDQLGPVAMVGDGINDAPALAASDVGVAMGCGADLTRESATVCLLADDLLRFPWAVALARQGVRTIRQNLFWAFVYNGVGIALAASGHLNPVWAAIAMAGSSLAVIANSLRLAHFPEPESLSKIND